MARNTKSAGGPWGPRGGTTLADSPGLAILVTCNYKGSRQHTLSGADVNAREMKKTFYFLNYTVIQLQNEEATKANIQATMKKVSDTLASYRGGVRNKVIVFAFSGHGGNIKEAEQLCSYDSELLDLEGEIILPLTSKKAVKRIPKLFFIEACRTKIRGVERKSCFENIKEENFRIDYATLPDHSAYDEGKLEGSMWMPKLARAMREENKSFQEIAHDVKKKVQGLHSEQPEWVDHLETSRLYLQQ